MKYRGFFFLVGWLLSVNHLFSQATLYEFPSVQRIHAHNDYQQAVPFWNAWEAGCGFIEVDVYYSKGEVFVAHDSSELVRKAKLEELYLLPIQQVLNRQGGRIYTESNARLGLVIDIKNETEEVVRWLLAIIESHAAIFQPSSGVYVVLSGARPAPATWELLPDCVFLDARLEDQLTPSQLSRVAMLSAPFGVVAKWNGLGVLRTESEEVLAAIVSKATAMAKPLRFWGTPDTKTAWQYLVRKGVSIIGTDQVDAASAFVKHYPKFFYQNPTIQPIYEPMYPAFTASPQQVIFLIGDGTGLSQLYAAYTANKQALSIFSMRQTGFLHTYSLDSYCTDSAAGATAYSSGEKTKNRYLGRGAAGERLESIMELLTEAGYKTAIVSSVNITDATPAAFYAHVTERDKTAAIVEDLVAAKQQLLIGEGLYLLEALPDLEEQLIHNGRQLIPPTQRIATTGKMLQLFPDNYFKADSSLNNRVRFGDRLAESLAYLSKQETPFFLVAESGRVDSGGHGNDMAQTVNEALSLDYAVGKALAFVDKHPQTLLLVLADHETGGLSLLDGSFTDQWVLGSFSTNDHTGVAIPFFAYGAGATTFQGVMENTAIFHHLKQLLVGE